MSGVADMLDAVATQVARSWPFLVEVAAKSFALLAITGLASLVLRNRSAAARHLVWTAGVVGVLALPLLTAVMPKWQVWPADWALVSMEIAQDGKAPKHGDRGSIRSLGSATPEDAMSRSIDAPTDLEGPAGSVAGSTGLSGDLFGAETGRGSGDARRTATDKDRTEIGASSAANSDWLSRLQAQLPWSDLRKWMILIWLVAAFVLLARTAAGQWMLNRLARSSRCLPLGRESNELKRLCAETGIRRTVRLFVSRQCETPMAWGLWNSTLLLPADCDSWSRPRLRSVLLHELAHIARRDCCTQFLAQLAASLYWFNPLAWLAARRMRIEREQACDDRVLMHGTKAAEYARHLLEVTVGTRPSHLIDSGAVGMARRSQLEGRIQAVLDRRRSRIPLPVSGAIALAAGMAAVVVALGSVGAAARVAESRDPDPPAILSSASQPESQRFEPGWQLVSKTLRGHVRSVAWSPDGRFVAFAEGESLRVHDAQTLQMVDVLIGHTAGIRSLAWSPDGERLASGGDDGTVRVWRADGHPFATFTEHEGTVNDVAWSPDGRYLASAGSDGSVRVCTADGHSVSCYRGHASPVRCVAWSSDGLRLASGDERQTLHLWNAEGAKIVKLEGKSGPIIAVNWSPDASRIAAVSQGRVDFRDDTRTTSAVSIFEADGTPGPVVRSQRGEIQDVAWSPDGESFACGGDDGSVWLWRPDGTPLKVIDAGYREVNTLAWSPNGEQIAIGSRNVLQIVHRDGTRGASFAGSRIFVQSVAWSADASQIAVGCEDGTVRMFGADQSVQWVTRIGDAPVHSVTWSSDGKSLAAGSGNRIIAVIRRDGVLMDLHSTGATFPYSVAFTPDGTTLAAGCGDRTVRLLDLATGAQTVLRGHGSLVHSVAWSPDGQWLASAGHDGVVRLWTRDGEAGPSFDGHEGAVDEVAWSPDGTRIAAGDSHFVHVWNIDGTPGPVLSAGDVIDVRWSPDGTKIAAAGWDSTVRLWDADGTPGPVTSRHSAPVVAIDWSPDSKSLVTGSYDGTFQVCDAGLDRDRWSAYMLDGGHSVVVDSATRAVEGYSQSVDREFHFAVTDASGKSSLVDYAEFRRRVVDNENR